MTTFKTLTILYGFFSRNLIFLFRVKNTPTLCSIKHQYNNLLFTRFQAREMFRIFSFQSLK